MNETNSTPEDSADWQASTPETPEAIANLRKSLEEDGFRIIDMGELADIPITQAKKDIHYYGGIGARNDARDFEGKAIEQVMRIYDYYYGSKKIGISKPVVSEYVKDFINWCFENNKDMTSYDMGDFFKMFGCKE